MFSEFLSILILVLLITGGWEQVKLPTIHVVVEHAECVPGGK